MSFNLIDSKMIVRNSISITPVETYISASLECSNFNKLKIQSEGIFGKVKSKNIVNSDYSLTEELSLKRLYLVRSQFLDREDKRQDSIVNVLNVVKEDNDLSNKSEKLDALRNSGIYQDNSGEFYFKVEKVKEKWLLDDKNYHKKQSIKNLLKFYRENIEHRVVNPRWGFSNYNCINFFNYNSLAFPDLTHKNYIAYPSRLVEDKEVYKLFSKFNSIEESTSETVTFSFYINQNKKNKKDYHFNPGCVLFIPGIIGIFIVKGTSTDETGNTDKYRLFADCGRGNFDVENSRQWINENINSSSFIIDSNQSDHFKFLSSNNILEYNNWHNVCLSLTKSEVKTSESDSYFVNINLKVSIDGKIIDENTITLDFGENINYALRFLSQNFDNTIFLGNRPKLVTEDESILGKPHDDYFKKLFSFNSESNDQAGPFINKFISFGKTSPLSNNVQEIPTIGFDIDINDKLELKTGDYITENTSFSLNAEIHDIRIYNKEINDISNKICKNAILDFEEENLIFYVPVYYHDEIVLKKSVVNIVNLDEDSLIYNKSDNTFTLIKANNVVQENLAFEGVSNVYFDNKCNGHEVIVEKFLREFKQGSRPNIVFNKDTKSDAGLYNTLNLITTNIINEQGLDNKSFSSESSILNLNLKKGESLNHIYNKFLYELDTANLDKDSMDQTHLSYFKFLLSGNLSYKNNLILPCDNGKQQQNLDNYKKSDFYSENYTGFGHIDESGVEDISHVSVFKNFSDKIVYKPEVSYDTYAKNSDLFLNSEVSNIILPEIDRQRFFVSNRDGKFFYESYDLLYNASLYNYYSNFSLLQTEDKLIGIRRLGEDNSVINLETLEADGNSFLKNLSNPVSRVINDLYYSSINNSSSLVYAKYYDDQNFIGYFEFELPVYNLNKDYSETYCNILCISNQIYNKRIEREETSITDYDLGGTRGSLEISLKDNGKGMLYRANCLTEQAKWNYVGNCLYKEGILTVVHPSLENFTENNYKLDFRSHSKLNTFELNLPAISGKTNLSMNKSYDEELRVSSSSFDADEPFVYITDINLHDENLNIIGKAKLAKPFAKKNSDNVLFRLKMDF